MSAHLRMNINSRLHFVMLNCRLSLRTLCQTLYVVLDLALVCVIKFYLSTGLRLFRARTFESGLRVNILHVKKEPPTRAR